MLAEIVLPSGTEFVTTRDIPALLAKALNPAAKDELRKITQLIKIARLGAKGKTAKWFRRPLSDFNWTKLNKIWADAHLPELVLPITEEAWQPYAVAFQQKSKRLRWELKPLISSPFRDAEELRNFAQTNHQEILRTAIASRQLEQLDPASHISRTDYLESGKVPVEALTDYVARFKIGVRVEGQGQPDAPAEAEASEQRIPLPAAPNEAKSGDNPHALGTATITRHKLRNRRNILDPAIDKAIQAVGNRDPAAVYLKLRELALSEEQPFTGATEKDALCYTNVKGDLAKLSRDSLARRLKRHADRGR